MQQGKEVIALDADDHLARPILILLPFSEKQQTRVQMDRLPTRNLLFLCAA
jgi:hypothetical protein